VRTELRGAYPAVEAGGKRSCGGSQNWFPDENFRRCGCGVIACADTLLYLRGRTELPQEEYMRYVNSLRRYFPLIPGRGIDGVRLAIGLNACFRRAGLPVRAGWSLSGRRFWDRLERMLADDLPAIVSIGPNFPRLWGRERVALYRRAEDGAYTEAERTHAHYLTALALDGEWMEVSSWGSRLSIRREEYERYMRAQGALMTNLLFLERR
jgi:hypothetical protein